MYKRQLYDRTSPATEPYHVSKIRRNVIGQDSWSAPGQWISYKIQDIPEDGLYYITLKYRQNLQTGQSSFRSLYINGSIPSTAYENVAFPYGVNWDTDVYKRQVRDDPPRGRSAAQHAE